ncbi:hypothetical protein GCM10010508_22660 [Streptomyces naganishii JCM 4654]|uniref:Uncharacterized protein n=1 Tax=Streptomyces naganishii JCM 4654 TaxID=1306179 RepID=A0A919CUU3_9ACTN|nr:hypothetical protein GCM10010508_22660 [Streptomyces naganishii JCM 4654]
MFELRLLIARQRGEQNRKLTIRSRSPPASLFCPVRPHQGGLRRCARTANRPLRAVRKGRSGLLGEVFVYFGAPTGFPSGETAYQVPPTPWPLMSPGTLSPEKV